MSQSLLSAPVPCPLVKLTYEQKDISNDIAPYLVEFSYVDHLSGESDEL